jgi:hypothetical protein
VEVGRLIEGREKVGGVIWEVKKWDAVIYKE